MKSYAGIILISGVLAVALSSCALLPSNDSSPTSKVGVHGCPPGERSSEPGGGPSENQSTERPGPKPPIQTAQLGAYTLAIYGPDGDIRPYLEFRQGDKVVKKMEVGANDRLELLNADEEANATPLFKLTDGSENNAVVMHYLGATSGRCYVFSVGKKLRKIATLSLSNFPPTFEMVDRSCVYRIVDEDLYKDWGIQAIAPKVVLKWKHGRFVLDGREMKKRRLNADPDRHLTQAIVDEFKRMRYEPGQVISQAPPELADEVISMYYCGEARRARKYFNHCWPKQAGGKEAYWSFLKSEMEKSPYWPQVKALNHGS